MAYSEVNKEALRALVIAELEIEFGSSQSPTTLDKYAHAIARAVAQHFYDIGFYPDLLDDP